MLSTRCPRLTSYTPLQTECRSFPNSAIPLTSSLNLTLPSNPHLISHLVLQQPLPGVPVAARHRWLGDRGDLSVTPIRSCPLIPPLNPVMASPQPPPVAYETMGSIPCLPPQPLASWLFWECIRLSPTTGPCHSMFPLPGNSQLPLLGSIVVSFWSQPKRYHLRVALSELLSKGVSLHPQPNLCAFHSSHYFLFRLGA